MIRRRKNSSAFFTFVACVHCLFCCCFAVTATLFPLFTRCDVSYFRKLSWPNCAVLELQWRRGKDRAERYRWVIPEPSPFIEAADAARIMKQGKDDTQFTV